MTEQQLSQFEDPVSPTPEPELVWRNEVQDRLATYKRRRGRRIEGAYTMRFPFPAEEITDAAAALPEVALAENSPLAEVEPVPEPEVDSLQEVAAAEIIAAPEGAEETRTDEDPQESNDFVLHASPSEQADEDTVFVDPIPRPRPKRKVIAFPRQSTLAPDLVQRLADPVNSEAPRILDVPEELEAIPSTPFLDGLQLDIPDAAAAIATSREHVDLPFQSVAISRRLFAGVVDLAVAAVAAGVFAAVAYQALDHPAPSKPLLLGVVAGAGVVWLAYQYLFVIHAGKTLGMMAAHIRFCTFAGRPPAMRQRRKRVLGLFLSSLSLGMGLLWGFVDVDGLCWHDRLSRTFLARRV
jgi:uncharacterized RDD family membrane protein YckC